jgi:hypothetical protein
VRGKGLVRFPCQGGPEDNEFFPASRLLVGDYRRIVEMPIKKRHSAALLSGL